MSPRSAVLLLASALTVSCQWRPPPMERPTVVVRGPGEATVVVDPAEPAPPLSSWSRLGGVVTVDTGREAVEVRVPSLARLVVGSAASVTLRGPATGRLEARVKSGGHLAAPRLDADTVHVVAEPGAVVDLTGRVRVVELDVRRAIIRAGTLTAAVARVHARGSELELAAALTSGVVDLDTVVRTPGGETRPVALRRLPSSVPP